MTLPNITMTFVSHLLIFTIHLVYYKYNLPYLLPLFLRMCLFFYFCRCGGLGGCDHVSPAGVSKCANREDRVCAFRWLQT